MAKEKVVVKTRVEAATAGFFQGNREQLIAKELRTQGIPAVGHQKAGITVEHGTLEVECEEGTGLHVFTWTPGEPQPAAEEKQQQAAGGEEQVAGEAGSGSGTVDLNKMTKAELIQYAEETYKLQLDSHMTKVEMIDAIEAELGDDTAA